MKSRPWSAYALRLLCSGLLFVSGYLLLVESTFALRLRDDFPVKLVVVAVAGILSALPLLVGRHYLGVFLVSGFLLSGIGGYWWTTIPWDAFIKDSGFPSDAPPGLMDYALVASPAILAAFYAAVSRASVLHADLRNRGADAHEVRRAAAASFVSAAALLALCGALSVALWSLMASGIVFTAASYIPRGVPALVIVAALVAVAWGILTNRIGHRASRSPRAPRKKSAPSAGGVKARLRRTLASRAP